MEKYHNSILADQANSKKRPMRFSNEFLSQDECDEIARDGFDDWEDEIFDEYNGFPYDIELNLHGDPVYYYLDQQVFGREIDMILTNELLTGDINAPKEVKGAILIQLVNNLLGKFKVYHINELNHSEFLENNYYLELNLLNPGFVEMEIPKLIDADHLDVDILKKYDDRAKEFYGPIKSALPIAIPSIVDSYYKYLKCIEEQIF